MTSPVKKPAGWYSRAAKIERAEKRGRRLRLEAVHRAKRGIVKAEAMSDDEREQAEREAQKRLQAAQQEADALAARVQRKAAKAALTAKREAKEYRRQAKELRRELRDTPRVYDKTTGEMVEVATPHARRQHRKTSIDRMIEAQQLTPGMYQAAQEIERVYLALTAGVLIRGQSYERQDRGAGDPMSETVALAYHLRYKPWADELSRRRNACAWPMLEVVIDIVIDGRSFDIVERDLRIAHGTAKFIVQWALLDYAERAGFCKRGQLREFERQRGLKRIPKSFAEAA